MKFKTEKAFHYFFMGAMMALIVISVVFVYMSTNGSMQKQPVSHEFSDAEKSGNKKPLPDFLVDKVPADELETLKP